MRRLHRSGEIGVNLRAVVILPQQADARRKPVEILRGIVRRVQPVAIIPCRKPVGAAQHQRQLFDNEKPAFAEHVQPRCLLPAIAELRPVRPARIHEQVLIGHALPVRHAPEQIGIAAQHRSRPIEAAEQSLGRDVLGDDDGNRMMNIRMRDIDAAVETQIVVETPMRLQRQAAHRLVAGPAIGDHIRARCLRRGQRVGQAQRPRHLLANIGAIGNQADFLIGAEAVSGVEGAAHLLLPAPVAKTIGGHAFDGAIDIPIVIGACHRRAPAHGPERAAFQPQHVRRLRRAACRRDQVDRAAKLRPPKTQRIAALVDFDIARPQRVDLLEIREPVGIGERHTILRQQHAALMIRLADAGAANGKPRFLAIAFFRDHARHIAQQIGHPDNQPVFIALRRHHGHRPRRAGQAIAGRRHHRRIVRIARRGDDHGFDLKTVFLVLRTRLRSSRQRT